MMVSALNIDVFTPEQGNDDLESLFESADAMVVWKAERVELRLVPAGAQAEDETASADLFDSVGHFGEHGRVSVAGAGDKWAELNPVGRRRQCRQERPAVPAANRSLVRAKVEEEMVRKPEGVEP
jgi:hypothetical protein